MSLAKPSETIGRLTGLSGKVLILTIIFVMLGEVLIFLPSIANFRLQWLKTRIAQGEIAALATDVSPDQVLDTSLRQTLLKGAGVEAVAVMRDGKRALMLSNENPGTIEESFDLRAPNYFQTIGHALEAMFQTHDRLIDVIDNPPAMTGSAIEITVHQAPLHEAMLNFSLRILGLSVVLSLLVAGLVFAALNRVMVKPMQRLSANMMDFAKMPEDPSRIIVPSSRRDELGMAEHQLQAMQQQLQSMLQQKSHLAALGLAVSKVSHDLRNMLTSAQLISDRLGSVKDARVQRFAPKLISSLDRAITFLNQTMTYGRAQELPPRREILQLAPLVDEVFETLRLQTPRIDFVDEVKTAVKVDADREQLVRILTNLGRNAMQAIETRPQTRDEIRISASRNGSSVIIRMADTGPGIPPAVRDKMFAAFQTAARRGGTGLGLAISSELALAHGGSITVVNSSESGTVFELNLPDRNRP